MSEPKQTNDHEKIRSWVEERGGKPAAVRGTEKGSDPGVLRIDFPDYIDQDSLREITWEQFFDKFEKERLSFLFEEEESEDESQISKDANRGDSQHIN